jgi:hypothetical protein
LNIFELLDWLPYISALSALAPLHDMERVGKHDETQSIASSMLEYSMFLKGSIILNTSMILPPV